MRMKLSPDERLILEAAQSCCQKATYGSVKCDRVLRSVLDKQGKVDESMHFAMLCDAAENRAVRRLYDVLRRLVKRGFLTGKGDMRSPAATCYTECGMTELGSKALSALAPE